MVNNIDMGQRLILSEEEKRNIQEMYGLINEQQKTDVTITKLVINKNKTGSSITLSNGETYNYSEGGVFKKPTMGYSPECKPGEYNGDNLPKFCRVYARLSRSEAYICDSRGCKKSRT